MTTTSLLLVGHGTRDARGVSEFLDTARQVAAQCADLAVEPCFLEIAEPTIAQGITTLINRGAQQILVSPVLLFAAGHAKRDIPEAVQAAIKNPSPNGRGQGEGAASSSADVRYAPALECHPAIVELSARRYHEALLGKPAVAPDDTLLLLVGRGSRDDTATAEMHRFAQLRAQQTPVGEVAVCFVAMAEPRIDAVLARVAALPVRRIVVQPHLLFAGELLSEVGAKVAALAAAHPDKQWLVTNHLGPDTLLTRALVELSHKSHAGETLKC